MNEKTLRRWILEDEEFKQELAAARQAMFQTGMNRMQALAGMAIDTLAALMGGQMPPTVRLGAARTVVELAIHHHDAETIRARLDKLEGWQRRQAQGPISARFLSWTGIASCWSADIPPTLPQSVGCER